MTGYTPDDSIDLTEVPPTMIGAINAIATQLNKLFGGNGWLAPAVPVSGSTNTTQVRQNTTVNFTGSQTGTITLAVGEKNVLTANIISSECPTPCRFRLYTDSVSMVNDQNRALGISGYGVNGLIADWDFASSAQLNLNPAATPSNNSGTFYFYGQSTVANTSCAVSFTYLPLELE